MIEILQINLRKNGPARRMIENTVHELGVDVLIMSEVPRGPPDDARWISSLDRKAAVALTSNATMVVVDAGREEDSRP